MTVLFGSFTFDSDTRQLAEGARPVHLSPKAFSLLQLLVERRPAVVQKEEIASRIWPGITVSEGSLGGLIKEIRRALGDDPARPAFIRTVHTVGYAFVAPVDGASTSASAADQGAIRCWLAWDDRTFSLATGEHIIGRDPRCTVWVDASGVSRRHARIVIGIDDAVIEDLGSRNGTAVGRTALAGPRRLEDGDTIRMGVARLTFRVWSDQQAPLTEPIARGRRTKRGGSSSQ